MQPHLMRSFVADPGLQDPVLWLQHTNTHGLQKSCGEKETAQPLSQEESTLTLALTGFYCFSRPLTSRMVSIYYAKVCFGWLSFTDNKGEDVTKYIKEGYLRCKGRNGRKWLCSTSGRSSSDFRKIKILSTHLLPQGEGVLARASLIAVKVQCRPDFPLENLSMDMGPARQPRSPLAFPSEG